MSRANIRMAAVEDAKEINKIYETYIKNTAVTFEYDPVPLEKFQERVRSTLTTFPYLVCEVDDKIVGYAYLAPFQKRAAFGWDVEITVYIHKDYHKRSIGKALYRCLIEIAEQLGYYNIYALIEDSNTGSIRLHESMGFEHVGLLPKTGFKFNQWWGLAVMCKSIGDFNALPQKPMNIHDMSQEMFESIISRYETEIR